MSVAALMRRDGQHGFSLVELMVAVTIALVMTGAATLVYLSNKQGYGVQTQLARVQEAGRFGLEAISRDVREAGFLGGYDTLDGPVTDAVEPGACNATDWGLMLGQRIYGVDDDNTDGTAAGNYTGADCIPDDRYRGGDILTVRRIMSTELDAADLVANGIYLKTDLGWAQLFTGTTEPTEGFATPEFMYPVVTHAYYLGEGANADRPCPDGGEVEPMLSLFRLSATAAGSLAHDELIRGVDAFQVQYGIDDDGNGSVDRLIDADGAEFATVDARGVATAEKIVAVRLWLLVRAACPEIGYTDGNTYPLGNTSFTAPAAEAGAGYRRELFTTTVMLRNPARGGS